MQTKKTSKQKQLAKSLWESVAEKIATIKIFKKGPEALNRILEDFYTTVRKKSRHEMNESSLEMFVDIWFNKKSGGSCKSVSL